MPIQDQMTTRQRRVSVDLLSEHSDTPVNTTLNNNNNAPSTTSSLSTATTTQPHESVSHNPISISLAPSPFSSSASSSSIDTPTEIIKKPDNGVKTTPNIPPSPPSSTKLSSFHALTRAHPFLMGWNHEDWWPCWIGLFLFGMVAIAVRYNVPEAHFLPWSSNPFDSLKSQGNYDLLVLFPLQGLLVWLALWAINAKAWKEFPKGYLVVYSVSFLSKWLAAQKSIKSVSLGDSIWAILFGAVIRNAMGGKAMPDGRSKPLVPWLKVAQQTELYIAISLVLLCIDFNVLKPLAPRALFVSWIDTPTLFVVVAMMGTAWLKIDLQTSMIMSGATFICGSSAAIALAASLGAGKKADLPIAIISVFTIPSIIALPYIAKAIHISATVAGAWFGGCVDSTGAVIAAATIYGDTTAVETAAVVKMVQNVLIGPISVGVAAVWTEREERRARQELQNSPSDFNKPTTTKKIVPYRTLLWSRFPKFVLGFVLTAILFNTAVPEDDRARVNTFSFMVGEWFSTMSFVSIGLGLQFHELRREARLLLKLTALYGLAQTVDILSTLALSYAAFELF